jgi:putative transposase
MRNLGDSPDSDFYHVISRVVDRQFVLREQEKEFFRKLLFKQAAFAGVTVVSWCFMSNHFHLLIEVPNKEKALVGWGDDDYLERLKLLNSEVYTRQVLAEIKMWKRNGNRKGVHRAAMAVEARIFDLSAFVKELKFKFSIWFNKQHGRRGTLWEERFRSVLLENGEAVRFCAAYIDLNPVRAGLCESPEDYRWCSCAAAVSGDKVSRKGLARAWGRQRWTDVVAREYRVLLFGRGEAHAGGETADGRYVKAKAGFSREQIEVEMKKGGSLPIWKVLRSRVRYFSDGAVLGSRSYVDSYFERRRSRFGPNRASGARKLRVSMGSVTSLRDLT